jgi:uncharacterized protein YkwD
MIHTKVMIQSALRVFVCVFVCAAVAPLAYSQVPDSEEWAFLTLINNFRAQNGLGPLQVSSALNSSSHWMSSDMAAKNYFSHTDSLGRDPFTRMSAFGYSGGSRGENIAAGYSDAQNAFNQWLTACDPDGSGNCTYAHRNNMLGGSYQVIGIGRASNPGSTYRWYWTTDFGSIVDQIISPGGGGTPTPPPAITSFSGSPSAITQGQSVLLSWSSTGANTLTINNGVGDVTGRTSATVSPSQTTAYTLTASNGGGTVTASVTITVNVPAPPPPSPGPTAPVIAFFSASPSAIASGQSAMLSWSVSGATSLTIDNGVGNVSGLTSMSVSPGQTTTYTLTASNSAGSATARVTVTVNAPAPPPPTGNAPVISFFTGTPLNIAAGQTVTLSWNTSGDTIRFIDNGVGGVNGLTSISVQPALTTTYTLTARNGSGTTAAQVTVQVGGGSSPPAPSPVIASFSANPSSIAPGQSATLSWNVSGANSISIDNGIGNVPGNSTVVSPSQTTTYRLTATNGGGSTTASATVTVSTGTPPGDSQPPSAPNLTSAAAKSATEVDLNWTPSTDNVGVTSYQILRNGSSLGTVGASSTFFADMTASPNTSYTYFVRAYDAAGNSTASNAAQATTPPLPASGGACPAPASGAFTGCYYSGIDLSGTPVFVRTDNQINFDWGGTPPASSVPADNYSIRWQGNFNFGGGSTTFTATTSDGMRLYVDGNLVMDRWRDQAATTYRVMQTLSPGTHLITVEYYANRGWSTAHVSWN